MSLGDDYANELGDLCIDYFGMDVWLMFGINLVMSCGICMVVGVEMHSQMIR